MEPISMAAIGALLAGQAIQGSVNRAAQAREAERQRKITGLGEAMGMERSALAQQQEAGSLALKDYINSLRAQLGA